MTKTNIVSLKQNLLVSCFRFFVRLVLWVYGRIFCLVGYRLTSITLDGGGGLCFLVWSRLFCLFTLVDFFVVYSVVCKERHAVLVRQACMSRIFDGAPEFSCWVAVVLEDRLLHGELLVRVRLPLQV